MDRKQFSQTLEQFREASRANYDSYSYAAGYFESLIKQMWDRLPAEQQQIFGDDMARALIKQQAETIAKLDQNHTMARV